MSKVIDNKEKKFLGNAGIRLEKLIHKRRRERDLKIKIIKNKRNVR
jgi:hypothetical protein